MPSDCLGIGQGVGRDPVRTSRAAIIRLPLDARQRPAWKRRQRRAVQSLGVGVREGDAKPQPAASHRGRRMARGIRDFMPGILRKASPLIGQACTIQPEAGAVGEMQR
jgi:hypothetical protein